MAELDPTVREFVNRFIAESDDEMAQLDEIWTEYRGRYPNGVPRDRLRWHLEQAGVDTEPTVDGVVVHGTVSSLG